MSVSMSRVFATAASVFAIAQGVRVDEEDVARDEVSAAAAPCAKENGKWSPSKCTTTTTTTTKCEGADCVNNFWPWHKKTTKAESKGEEKKEKKEEKKEASLLQQDQKGDINNPLDHLMGDLKQFGRDVEYQATHLGNEGGGAAAHKQHKHNVAAAAPPAPLLHVAAATATERFVKGSLEKTADSGGDTAEALIDEILGEDTTTAASEETTTAADGETTESAEKEETTKAAEGETTKAAEGETTKAAGSTTAAAETTKEALMEANDNAGADRATTTAKNTAVLGDDLISLRARLDSLPVEKD